MSSYTLACASVAIKEGTCIEGRTFVRMDDAWISISTGIYAWFIDGFFLRPFISLHVCRFIFYSNIVLRIKL